MENSEENIKLRSITGGYYHRSSFVCHIEYGGIYNQYTINHINENTINLRFVNKNMIIYFDFPIPQLLFRFSSKA